MHCGAHLRHEGPGPGPGGLGGPGRGHQLHHGGVVGRVAGVRHDELPLVHHEVGDLAGHDAGGGGAEDGLLAHQLIHLPPHLPLEVEHLGHALLHVLGAGDALGQAARPADEERLLAGRQAAPGSRDPGALRPGWRT